MPEAGDGTYDASYWEDPNTVFQQLALPTLQQFTQYFPKKTVAGGGITYMPSDEVYEMVGGDLKIQNQNGNPNYQNACAIRACWAFNHIIVNNTFPFIIPANTANSGQGANSLWYLLSAKAFNAYMHKRFGNPSHSITSL